jgi:hypothetical protein
MEETMVKTIALAALALSLALLPSVSPADAQGQAPIGHRQPSATDVPANDSVRGDPALAGAAAPAAPAAPTKKSKRTRRVQSNVDVIMKTPNICSNCNE